MKAGQADIQDLALAGIGVSMHFLSVNRVSNTMLYSKRQKSIHAWSQSVSKTASAEHLVIVSQKVLFAALGSAKALYTLDGAMINKKETGRVQ